MSLGVIYPLLLHSRDEWVAVGGRLVGDQHVGWHPLAEHKEAERAMQDAWGGGEEGGLKKKLLLREYALFFFIASYR